MLLSRVGAPGRPEPRPQGERVGLRTLAELQLPEMTEVTTVVVPSPSRAEDAPPASPGGVAPLPRPDDDEPGRGGRREGARAVNLAQEDQGVALAAATRSRLDRDQLERDRDGHDRSSPDPRRALLAPMELTFVAAGRGVLALSRDAGEARPSRGASWADAPERRGAELGGEERGPGEGAPTRTRGSAVLGGAREAPAPGWIHGERGRSRTRTADVRDARPEVAAGRDAVPTRTEGPARDVVTAEQEVSLPVRSLLHASPRGGVGGEGPGGEAGPGIPAAGGGDGRGSSAKALGAGAGGPSEADELDRRRTDYERRIKAKIHPLWADAFPRWAALDGLAGRAIVRFVVARDGAVTSAVVARPSGVPVFDENVRRAVLRASPLPPVPEGLSAPFVVFLGFDAPNPTVR